MNKKIMLSGFSILTALTLMGGSALAAFTTTATASNNTFSTSNPSLVISTTTNTNTEFGISKQGFTVTGIVPGSTTADQHFWLKNSDTNPDALSLNGLFTSVTPVSGSILNDLKVTIACDVGSGSVSYGPYSITTWATSPISLGSLPSGATAACTMNATLDAGSAGDAHQSVNFDAVFGGSVGL